jgi:hypothetical protein
LIELALAPRRDPRPAAPPAPLPRDLAPYLGAAIEGERARVLAAVRGERNHRVNESAFRLGTLLGHGLARDLAEQVLLAAALGVGLGEREATRTIRSGLDAGARHPRQIGDRSAA